jgi:hypothetical protein
LTAHPNPARIFADKKDANGENKKELGDEKRVTIGNPAFRFSVC